MIGRNPDMSCSTLDHGQHGSQYSTDGADFPPIHIGGGGHGIKVPEQFISPVNQVHIHMAPSIRECLTLIGSGGYERAASAWVRFSLDRQSFRYGAASEPLHRPDEFPFDSERLQGVEPRGKKVIQRSADRGLGRD